MNLYQTLNQDLREFRMKSLLESEVPAVEDAPVEEVPAEEAPVAETVEEVPAEAESLTESEEIVEEAEKSEEDEIAERLVSLGEALDIATDDAEAEAITNEINELKAKLNEILANKENSVVTDSEDDIPEGTEEVIEEIPVEEPVVEETIEEPEAHEDKICLSLDEIKDCIEELSEEDKEALRSLLNGEPAEEGTEEPIVEEVPAEEEVEEFKECEITNYRVVRMAPSSEAFMIEAQTKDGVKFITGKKFDAETKTLEEAEITESKMDATNRFKSLLVK